MLRCERNHTQENTAYCIILFIQILEQTKLIYGFKNIIIVTASGKMVVGTHGEGNDETLWDEGNGYVCACI